ncbi:glycosyl transferase family protein [Ramlibacter sp.]|uniref:glycosyl transferase family protein n=1 Tax=Ramlibacter sp. TaxID=1917967 RepID=UPI00263781E3|nr:glycosyl transferase family protein [Ramlibacter sp.]MDB5956134.1 glycosyl transferase family protein [Ramlibacter sp.]
MRVPVAEIQAVLEAAAVLVALAILLSSLDDLFIDGWYWTRRLARWWSLERTGHRKPLTPAQLLDKPEQPIAIMVPAWKESDVIAAMVENLVQVMDYREYVVFIGTYCNDAETIAEVERVRRRYRQVHRVEVPHPGPTCKADCLNCVVDTILAYERDKGITFAGVVLHDSEDVLHPLELRFFNYLLPRKDMIQLPVASLERKLTEWVAGTYMDEFAESHGKEMVVRESIAGMVPSAGVGTCFSRRALDALIGENGGEPFNTASLTEDYDVGMRLQALDMQSIFGIFPVDYRVRRRDWRGQESEQDLCAPLSVREFFPDSFRAAYRQKSRWVLGIGLQGWHQIPWRGRSFAARYLMLHDRKGVLTSFISIAAYVLSLLFVLLHAGAAAGWWEPAGAHLFVPGSPWIVLLWANAGFFAVRGAQRAYFTARLYGWRHGVMSLPRMVIGNFVNCMAVGRAWRLYIQSVILGKKLAWDKTAHDFPTSDQLGRARQRLGELLQTWRAVDATRLEDALREHGTTGVPLGRVLVANGWLDEDTLAEAVACQADLPRAQLTSELVREHASGLDTELAARHRAVFIGRGEAGEPLLAVAVPLEEEALAQLAQHFGAAPLQRIALDSELAQALEVLCAQSGVAAPVSESLAQVLADNGSVDRRQYEEAVREYRPEENGGVGEFLVERGVLVAALVEKAVHRQRELAANVANVANAAGAAGAAAA